MPWVGLYVDTTLDNMATAELGRASARGMHAILGHSNEHEDLFTRGHRWRYHPEYSGHYPNFTGRVGRSWDDGSAAEKDADAYGSAENSWIADASVGDTAGFMCRNLNTSSHEPPPGQSLRCDTDTLRRVHVRLRLRLPSPPTNTATQIVRVYVIDADSVKIDTVITAGHRQRTPSSDGPGVFLNSDINYGEVYVGSFDHFGKTSTVDIRVRWLGNTRVILDYVAIDDSAANALFSGGWDEAIDYKTSIFGAAIGQSVGRMQLLR
jgi:hypothetical protein